MGRALVLLATAAMLSMPPVAAMFTVTLTASSGPIAQPTGVGYVNATFSLDCQSVLQRSAAAGGSTSIPVTVDPPNVPKGVTVTGVAGTIAIETAQCQSPSATTATAHASFVVAADSSAPGLQEIPIAIHGRVAAIIVAGNVVAPAQDDTKSANQRVAPHVALLVLPSAGDFDVEAGADATKEFNLTFENAGNVPLDLGMNVSAAGVAIDAPNRIAIGTASDPLSGPSRQTAPFVFHAPLTAWTEAHVTLVFTPQVHAGTATIQGVPVTVNLTFHNAAPAKKSGAPAAPIVAAMLLSLAAVAGRRRN